MASCNNHHCTCRGAAALVAARAAETIIVSAMGGLLAKKPSIKSTSRCLDGLYDQSTIRLVRV